MQCPVCNNDMFMKENKIKVIGDSSPTEQTQVFFVPQFICTDPQCTVCENKTVIEGEKIPVYGANLNDINS